jgi:hypothetical protein
MVQIMVDIVFGTLIYGLFIYGPLFLIVMVFMRIKYPNLYINTNKRTRFGFYFYLNPKYADIDLKYEKIYFKILPIISFAIAFIYWFIYSVSSH